MTYRRRRRPFEDLLGDAFPGFGDFDEIVDKMFDEVGRKPGGKDAYYYGLQVSVGPDGKPVVREFGNIRPARRGQLPPGTREPLVDVSVDEKARTLKIVAEMPGASKDSIKLNATGKSVTLSSDGESKPYSAEVPLPSEVEPESAEASYNNGILEVVFKLKGKPEPNGVNVKVK